MRSNMIIHYKIMYIYLGLVLSFLSGTDFSHLSKAVFMPDVISSEFGLSTYKLKSCEIC